MGTRCRIWTLVWTAFLVTAIAAPAWAQAPKPKAKAKAAAAEEAEPGAGEAAEPAAPKAKPKPKPPAAKGEKGKPEGKLPAAPEKIEKVEPEDPAVLALLETKPSTPAEWIQTAQTLAKLQKPKLAKEFLQKVLAAKLDQKQLAALAEQLGSATFVQLSGREELAPEGEQLANAALAAAESELREPQRLAGLVKLLQDPSAEKRYQALVGLQQARGAAVGPLAAVLADPARAAEHPNVRAALVRLGADALRPLVGILESPDAKLKAEAMRALADMDARSAAVFLLAPYASPQSSPEVRAAAQAALQKLFDRVPTKAQAAQMLATEAQAYFDGRKPVQEDLPGQVDVWFWDDAKKQCVARTFPTEEAARVLAARLARDAYSVSPEDKTIRLLYLATMLERAAYENGLDKPLKADAGAPAAKLSAFGPQVVEELLVYALEHRRAPAATAAARILGQIGTAQQLLYQGAQPAPLVRAVRHPDARLRLAAVEAIVALEPTQPFAGSTYVTEALGFFIASTGSRRVLVADPSTAEARRLVGFFATLGHQVDTAATGREMLRMAMASPDYELIMVDSGLDQPPVGFLIQQLRRDFRTGSIPVGIVARAGQLDRAEHLARNDPLAEAFPRLHAQETLRSEVERLLSLGGRKMVTAAERRQHAARAMQWLAQLSAARTKVFDLARLEGVLLEALKTPELSAQAAAVLGTFGTPASQRALVDLASRWSQPLEVRKAALAAFRESTQKHGLLLTIPQIALQYERYNQSRSLDQSTQQVLGLILDCIEAPTRAARDAQRAGGSEVQQKVEGKKG